MWKTTNPSNQPLGQHVRKHFLASSTPLVITSLVLACLLAPDSLAQQSYGPLPQQQQERYVPVEDGQDNLPDTSYAQFTDQAMQAYRKGDSTRAIDLMLKAYQLAPTSAPVINNLSAAYIQRGVYFQNTKKDAAKAVSDYRKALFYLVYDWPAEVKKTETNEANVKILKENLSGVYQTLKVPASDWKWHLKAAGDLRRTGNLTEALVEYATVTSQNPRHTESWMAQGDIYTVRQKPDKALTAYQKAADSTSSPSDVLLVKLGTALFQSGNSPKAVEAYNKALAVNPKNQDALLALEQIWKKEIVLNPRNMSAHVNLGAVYQQLERLDEAYAQYQVADRLAPNNPVVKLNLGSLLQAKGNWQQAAMMYDSVLQQNPGNVQALLYKADVMKSQGHPQEAEQLLQRALQNSADKKQILDQLIAIHKAQGNAEKIKADWALYTSTFPTDAAVQYQAGLALHEQRDYEGAIQYYQNAIQLDPALAEAYANMGTAYHAVNQDDVAISHLKKAIALKPDMAEVKTLIADIQQKEGSKLLVEAAKAHEQGQYEEAIRGYEQVLKQDPRNADVYARYGLALQALKRYEQAKVAYDKALALDANNAHYYYYKATVFDELNQLAQAKPLYEKAVALDPDLAEAKNALADLTTAGVDEQLSQALTAYNQKNYVKALQLVDSVIKLDPNNATAYYYRGLTYDAQKKPELARAAYEKSIALDGQLSDALYALAVLLDTQGKKLEAKKNYQQFLGLMKDQPEDDFVKYAKSRAQAL
jgi:tetratricopeptide (TPR) repeat protein